MLFRLVKQASNTTFKERIFKLIYCVINSCLTKATHNLQGFRLTKKASKNVAGTTFKERIFKLIYCVINSRLTKATNNLQDTTMVKSNQFQIYFLKIYDAKGNKNLLKRRRSNNCAQ